jgi:hypothetical protein
MLYASILATFTRHDSSALLMLFCSAGNGERGQWFLHAQLILQSVLIWNWQNAWISFAFQGERLVEEPGIDLRWGTAFWGKWR